MLVQVLHTRQYGSENSDGILLGKAATLANSLKEFSADRELEIEIVR